MKMGIQWDCSKIKSENEPNILELDIAIAVGQITTYLVLIPYFLHT